MLRGLTLLAAAELKNNVARTLRAAPYFAVGILILIIGCGFLLDMAHMWLSMRMGAMAASGVLAALLLSVAGICLLIGVGIKSRRDNGPGAMATTALVGAPVALKAIAGNAKLGTLAIAGMFLIGTLLGRRARS